MSYNVTTKIFENPAVRSMRALVVASLDRINFRHHGIGVLQGYIVENSDPEIRVHIWSRKLLKPGMEVSGDVHDHRFDMVSHVIAGFVDHEEFNEFADPNGSYATMALTRCRAPGNILGHGPTAAIEGRFSVNRRRMRILAGHSYSFPSQKFHRSPLDENSLGDLGITVVEKHRFLKAQARLLYPIAREPVMAFGHIPDQELIRSVVESAKERLRDS